MVGGRNGVTCMCFSTHADMLFVGDAKGFVTVLEWDPVNALIKKKPLAYKKVSESPCFRSESSVAQHGHIEHSISLTKFAWSDFISAQPLIGNQSYQS